MNELDPVRASYDRCMTWKTRIASGIALIISLYHPHETHHEHMDV